MSGERRPEGEEEYLEQIKKAVKDRNMEGLEQVYVKLNEALERDRLGILLLQEISYRIYYGLMDLLPEKDAAELGLEPLDWRDMPHFIRYPDWKEKIWDQISIVAFSREEKDFRKTQGTIGQIIAYVEENFREQISLKSVAERFYINSSYLGRSFQKATGANFKQYVNDLRIEEAKRLLRTTDKMIYEIAEETGFTESKYFISRFTAQVGISPLEYRKKGF